jgi:hypothetical protein
MNLPIAVEVSICPVKLTRPIPSASKRSPRSMRCLIPAAGDPVDKSALAHTVYRMTERVLRWMEDIGVRYVVEVRGEERLRYCWWDVPEPI